MKKHLIYIIKFSATLKAAIAFLIICALPIHLQGQRAGEYQVKAAFVYNFVKFVEWPANAFETDSSPFIIGIYGNNPFGGYLAEIIRGESVFGRPMVINKIDNPAEAGRCHILFVNARDTDATVLAAVRGKPVLTVSDHPEFCRISGCIRFFPENETIRLEININAAKDANLVISSKLLRIAKIYP